jgi:hypothetical protein
LVDELTCTLADLRGELERHFSEEEAGGCLEEAIAQRPSLGHEATRLERQHPLLLADVERLIAALRSAPSGTTTLDRMEADFHNLAKQLHTHEHAETSILEESFGIPAE